MRIYLTTTPNKQVVPFNYQAALVGALHKWLGENDHHDDISLYSLSWLSRGNKVKNGLEFPYGANFFISTPQEDLLKKIISGVQRSPEINFGLEVREMTIQVTPKFGVRERFIAQSPVLVKRTESDNIKFYFPENEVSDTYMTETLQHKLEKAGKGQLKAKISFDRSYDRPRTKVAAYKGIDNKGTLCPVIVEGDPEAVAFAWEVGAGNSTGIGFGALK